MSKKPRIGEENFNYDDRLEAIRLVVNEHDQRLEVIEETIPKTPELPKTREECEKAGGKWDDEKNVCVLPPKKEVVEGIGILPTSNSPDVEGRAEYFREKILGKEEAT